MSKTAALNQPGTLRASDRAFGLDVCRALAVLLVISAHLREHSNPHPWVQQIGLAGLFGVDLFFCLSGFLIGRILLAESQDWPNRHEVGLYGFWYRRWMRTLPLYFFYLIVSLKFDWAGETDLATQYPYLFFAQNLAWKMPNFYRLSWSLATEEWFYLTFPLLLLLLSALGMQRRRSVILTIGAFIVAPFLFRVFLPSQLSDVTNFDEGIRSIVVFRLDAIGFGVAMAYFYMWHREKFDRLAQYWQPAAILALCCATYTLLGYPGMAGSSFLAPCYFTVSAFAFALLIPKFFSLHATQFALLNRLIKFTSKISYSLYLGHIFAFILAMNLLHKLGLFDQIYPNPWLSYPLFLGLSYALASATYYLIERPMLKLRDKTSHGAFHPIEQDSNTLENNQTKFNSNECISHVMQTSEFASIESHHMGSQQLDASQRSGNIISQS